MAIRTVLSAFPERYELPPRPPANALSAVQDAHRQTHFLLGADAELFRRAMELQLAIVRVNAKRLTPERAALLAFWSRVYDCLAGACTLMSQGSYAACAPLLRTACDCLAAQRSLIADGFTEYAEWVAGGVAQDRDKRALAFDLGRFRAGSVLAADEALGPLYRLLTDLSMPHFGSTALQVAPDSGPQKLALTFADRAFHLGWAELVSGWLLTLALAQLDAVTASGLFATPDETGRERERLRAEVEERLSDGRRCRAEDADGRFLFHNFRPAASGLPKRVILG